MIASEFGVYLLYKYDMNDTIHNKLITFAKLFKVIAWDAYSTDDKNLLPIVIELAYFSNTGWSFSKFEPFATLMDYPTSNVLNECNLYFSATNDNVINDVLKIANDNIKITRSDIPLFQVTSDLI